MTLPLSAHQHVHEDQHWVTLTPVAPLDVLGPLARALAEAGVLEEFCFLGRNLGRRRLVSWDALRGAGIDWAQVLGVKLSVDETHQLAAALERAAWEPDTCRATNCNFFAAEDSRFCAEHEAEFADPWMTDGVA